MALAPDATSVLGSVASSGTSFTWNHTCTGSNLVLVVCVGMVATSIVPTSVTYNGANMRRVAGPVRDLGGSELFNYIYVLIGPSTGAHAIVVNVSGTLGADFGAGSAISFTGAHQTYPTRSNPEVWWSGASALSTTIPVTSPDAIAGDYIVGTAVGHEVTISQGANNTAINTWNAWNSGANTSWATAYAAATTTSTLSWTQPGSNVYSCALVTIRPATDSISVPQIDNVGQFIGQDSTSSLTITSFSVGAGTKGLLLVGVVYYAGSGDHVVSGVTFNTTSSLTFLDSNTMGASNAHLVVEWWYLKSPPAATGDIVVTFNGTVSEATAGADSWWLVDQTTPFGTVAKANNTSAVANANVTVTSSTSAIVHDVLLLGESPSLNFRPNGSPLGARRWRVGSSGDTLDHTSGQAQAMPGAASVGMNWTGISSYFIMMGVGINFGAPPVDSSAITPSYYLGIGSKDYVLNVGTFDMGVPIRYGLFDDDFVAQFSGTVYAANVNGVRSVPTCVFDRDADVIGMLGVF